MKEIVEGLRQGFGPGPDHGFGSLTTERQKKIVEEHIQDALEKGAKILAMDTFKTDQEALEKANNSDLGLTASVWTNDTVFYEKGDSGSLIFSS